MKNVLKDITMVLVSIIIVAIVAVLVSKGAQTPAVIGSLGSAFTNSIKAATAPVNSTA